MMTKKLIRLIISVLVLLLSWEASFNQAFSLTISNNKLISRPKLKIKYRRPLALNSINDISDRPSFIKEVFDIVSSTGITTGAARSLQIFNSAAILAKDFIIRKDQYIDRNTNKVSGPKILRKIFEELGATYIKLGQFIASSPTIFPADYVLEFQSCLDRAPFTPFPVIRKIIEKELKNKLISQVFSYIDPVPLACASIAQVHYGILKESGKEVVLKIRKPGVDVTLKHDLGFLYVAVRIAEMINPSLSRVSLANIIGDIRQSMLEELDFKVEAKHLENFRTFLDRHEIIDAVAPMPYLNISSERLLVMEYLKGVPLADLEGIKAYSASPEYTLITALKTWALSVINNDIYHADVHAGNLLVLEDGRVGFIDFGIVGKLSNQVRKAVVNLTESLGKGDFLGISQSLIHMGATSSKVDELKFAHDIESIFISLLNNSVSIKPSDDLSKYKISDRETTEIVLQIVEVADKYGLKLPREFGLLMKQALYFDRYQKLLAPNFNPLIYPFTKDTFDSKTHVDTEVFID